MKAIIFCVIVAFCATVVLGSSHSEAPGTAARPNADITDFYAFRSYETGRQNFVTVLMNTYPLEPPFGGPNYFTLSSDHYYELNIDNNGDCREDFVYRFMFGSNLGGNVGPVTILEDEPCSPAVPVTVTQAGGVTLPVGGQNVPIPLKLFGVVTAADKTTGLNWQDYYSIQLITNGGSGPTTAAVLDAATSSATFRRPFDYSGNKAFPDYAAYAKDFIYGITIPNCATPGKVFVGQRKDSFSINLGKVFDLINFIPIPGFPSEVKECDQNNVVGRYNVVTLALELPISCITAGSEPVVGLWGTVRELLHDGSGNHVPGDQVSRLGNPLVNELVIGLRDKATFNWAHPTLDAALAVYVTHPTLPAIINLLFLDAVNKQLGASLTTLAPTKFPRKDLTTVFLEGIPGLTKFGGTPAVCEYMRLNTGIAPIASDKQSPFGVLGNDTAGMPNGRRPGDDSVDIALRVMMGALCHGQKGAFGCVETDAPVGNVAFTDGAPQRATDFDSAFPYLKTPNPGALTGNPCSATAAKRVAEDPIDTANVGASSQLQSFLSFLF